MTKKIVSIGIAFIILIVSVLLLQKQRFSNSETLSTNYPSVSPSDAEPQTFDEAPINEEKQGTVFLTVSSPTQGSIIKTSSVLVQGKTVPNAEVFINELEIKADAKGSFSQSVALDEGENILVVFVNDADGNIAMQELSVTYESN